MKIKQTIILVILFSIFNSTHAIAQNKGVSNNEEKEYLKGLSKAEASDLLDKDIKLDGEKIPIYDVNGNRIRGMELLQTLSSGNYSLDIYIDESKDIKVAVLIVQSEEDKKKVKEIQTKINSDSSGLIGTDAIAFSVIDINGREYSLNDLKGKIIVMNFWFIECKPCIREIPELNGLVENYKNKDVVFLGFATNDKSKIQSFLQKRNFSYNIIANSQKIATDYKVSGYPTHIIIDKNSKIIYSTTGFDSTTIPNIEKTIKRLIKN